MEDKQQYPNSISPDTNNFTKYKFYILFSKKAVDDLLENTGTDKNSVKYYGKFGDPKAVHKSERSGDYTYQQFTESSWEDFEELHTRPGGPRGKVKMIPADKKLHIG